MGCASKNPSLHTYLCTKGFYSCGVNCMIYPNIKTMLIWSFLNLDLGSEIEMLRTVNAQSYDE